MDAKRGIRRLSVVEYSAVRTPKRMTVGDVICCRDFRRGFRNVGADNSIVVGWRDPSFREYFAASGKGTLDDDESRGTAPFLVTSVVLTEGSGPEDLYPGEKRLSLEICCWRLTDELELVQNPETIQFSLKEPMNVSQPDEDEIKLVGYVELPIIWNEKS